MNTKKKWSSMLFPFEDGNKVYVSGEVMYGKNTYRVSSVAEVIDVGMRKSLLLLDEIDGDRLVQVLVENRFIKQL